MHSSTLLEFFSFFINHNYVCGGDLVLLLHVFMKKKETKKEKKTYFNGKDAENLFCHLLLTTMRAREPCTYSGLSYAVRLYLVNGSTNVLHSNSLSTETLCPSANP